MRRPRFTVEEREPSSLLPNPANFRRHPDSQRRALASSVAEHGWLAAPLLNQRTGHLLDGHARVELALSEGEESLPVNVIDVPLSQERRILRSFDAITSLALVDDEALDALVAVIDDAELEQLLGEAGAPVSGLLPGADPDALPLEVETRCKAGDLWRLSEHRLLCGDSTKAEDVERLMGGREVGVVFADPPYGARSVQRSGALQGKGGARLGATLQGAGTYVASRAYAEVVGDEDSETALNGFRLLVELYPAPAHIWWGAEYYAGYLPTSRGWLVWDKERENDFGAAELAWTNQQKPIRLFRHAWNGLVKDSERGETRTHPNQKPVALVEWCLGLLPPTEGVLFDPFAGSGISLVAAEQLKRTCCAMEISPAFCDVILARWEQATGKTGERLDG